MLRCDVDLIIVEWHIADRHIAKFVSHINLLTLYLLLTALLWGLLKG
jgi:hypothetical protein